MPPITIQGTPVTKIDEGKHTAEITKLAVEARGKQQYQYLDVYVRVTDVTGKDGKNPEIKMGMPFNLNVQTTLGKVLKAFGVSDEQIESGDDLDLEAILKVGTKVNLLCEDEEGKEGGVFAKITKMTPA